ncbi:hypothetical protein Ancab_035183 [Ancistrocladus abbreviatus]
MPLKHHPGNQLYYTSQKNPLQLKESNGHDFLPKRTFEPVATSTSTISEGHSNNSEVSSPSVHLLNSKVVRQILELMLKPATPEEKSEELNLVTTQRNPSSSELLSAIPNEQTGFWYCKGNSFFKFLP